MNSNYNDIIDIILTLTDDEDISNNIAISGSIVPYLVTNKESLEYHSDFYILVKSKKIDLVRNKVRNTYLTGKDYKSFVKYWMAYSGNNYGIHDASWRNKFGGSIYKANGSHGCVNVPTDAAAKLYNMLDIGTPVYIKR